MQIPLPPPLLVPASGATATEVKWAETASSLEMMSQGRTEELMTGQGLVPRTRRRPLTWGVGGVPPPTGPTRGFEVEF